MIELNRRLNVLLAVCTALAFATALGGNLSAALKGEPPVAWDHLAKMDYKTGKRPDILEKTLDKKELRVRGYAIPVEVVDFDNIKEFILVPSQFGCCQGPPPDPNQIIEVTMVKPVPFDKLMGIVYLTGKLGVKQSGTGEYGYTLSKAQVFEPDFDT